MRLANEYHCRIIGPNCMGVYDPQSVDTMFLPAIGYFLLCLSLIPALPSPISVPLVCSRRAEPWA